MDWNSQVHVSGQIGKDAGSPDVARKVLRRVCRDITRTLRAQSADMSFRVRLRLYSGWHQGYEPTARRRAVFEAKEPAGPDDAGVSDFGTDRKIVFTDVAFGDRLLHALERRMNAGTGCHLPGTFLVKDNVPMEKMVDTALAADLLYIAASEEGWLMVVGQDRDLVPPIFVAEAMLSGTDRRVILLARDNIRFLHLEELQCR